MDFKGQALPPTWTHDKNVVGFTLKGRVWVMILILEYENTM